MYYKPSKNGIIIVWRDHLLRLNQKYSLFVSTASGDPTFDEAKTGDVDYAIALTNAIHAKTGNAHYIQGCLTEKSIYQYIWTHTCSKNPILHIMINADKIGFAFSQRGLSGFKAAGGKVVMTSVEFYKHTEDKYRTAILNYLKEAESVIFLDELDKDDAIRFQEKTEPNNMGFNAVLKLAKVIPVPPTIEHVSNPLSERGSDILYFGMIRAGKGFAHIIKLAGLIKNSTNSAVKRKKILVVGNVPENNPNNKELHKLMAAIYPEKSGEIERKNVHNLKKLLRTYQDPVSGLEAVLPIELHIDVAKKDLAPLFNRCKYAFLPMYRGASLRNTSISSALAQPFVIYSYVGSITANSLKPTGEHGDSLVLLFDETRENNIYGVLADRVLADIIKREQNPVLNQETFRAAQKLMDSVLSHDNVASVHLSLYCEIGVDMFENGMIIDKLKKILQLPKSEKQSIIEKNQSYGRTKRITGFDIDDKGERNFRALRTRLKMVEGPMPEEMIAYIKEKKDTKDLLTPEEKIFFHRIIEGDWVLKHVTPSLDKIVNNGNMLLSGDECKRRFGERHETHTNKTQGHSDNVFFSFGPGDIETVRFLDHVPTVITVDYKRLLKEKNGLKSTWFSDHFYAYSDQQTGERVNVYGTTYSVNYRLIFEENNREPHWIKECTFSHSDGTFYKQIIHQGEEIFTYPRLDIAVTLMTIEKIRLLGKNAWKQIMQEAAKNENLSVLQRVVEAFFHTGVCEVHKPVTFSLDNSGVAIQERTINFDFSAYSKKQTALCDDERLNAFFEEVLKSKPKDLEESKLYEEKLITLLEDICKDKKNPKILRYTAIDSACLWRIMRTLDISSVFIPILLRYSSIPKDELQLTLAVKRNSFVLISHFLNLGADINAAQQGCNDQTRISLTDTERKEVVSYTPLLIAVKDGNLKMVEFLLDNHAEIDGFFLFGCLFINHKRIRVCCFFWLYTTLISSQKK